MGNTDFSIINFTLKCSTYQPQKIIVVLREKTSGIISINITANITDISISGKTNINVMGLHMLIAISSAQLLHKTLPTPVVLKLSLVVSLEYYCYYYWAYYS